MILSSSESPFLEAIWRLSDAIQQAALSSAVHSIERMPARGTGETQTINLCASAAGAGTCRAILEKRSKAPA